MKTKTFSRWLKGLAFMVAAFLAWPAYAGSTLTLSSGVAKGGYNRWSNEAKNLCQDVVKVNVITSDGGPANLNALANNDAHIAPVQADNYFLAQNSGLDTSNLRVLLTLFPEQVHFVARADLVLKSGGWGLGNMRAGETVTPVTDVSQIQGMNIAAAGGAIATSQFFVQATGLHMNVQADPGNNNTVLDGVVGGKYQVGILVGAAPMDALVKLDPAKKAGLRLLSVTGSNLSKLESVYQKAAVSYAGMAQGNVAVPTVQVKSLLITQNIRRGPTAQAIADFRQCIYERAADQAGEVGSHPAWRLIKATNNSNFPMYEDPADMAPAQPATAPRPLKGKK